MKHPAQGRRDGGSSGCESACAQDHQAGARPATGSARPRARTGRSGKHERERGLCDGITVIPSHRGRPVRDVPGRTGQPAAHGARRRTPARREPVARADGARPRFGTRRIEVRLARGPLRPRVRMRLDIDRWSSSSTALELIPCGRVRPTAAYFRAGHLLLDLLIRSLPQHLPPAHARDTVSQPPVPAGSRHP